MASRPFASVAVALDVGGDREELLQVRIQHKHATTCRQQKEHPKRLVHGKEKCHCVWKETQVAL